MYIHSTLCLLCMTELFVLTTVKDMQHAMHMMLYAAYMMLAQRTHLMCSVHHQCTLCFMPPPTPFMSPLLSRGLRSS